MINNDFPDIGKVMDPELDPSDLGYSTFYVSVFDHWLTREEYESIFPLTQDKIYSFAEQRIKFYLSIEGTKYEYEEEYSLLSKKQYLTKINSIKEGKLNMDFYVPEYKLCVEGGYDQTDKFYYQDDSLIQPIIRTISDNKLFILYDK